MAISYALKTSGAIKMNGGAGGTTTAAFTPANNSLLLAMLVMVDGGDGNIASSLTVADTASLSWTPRITNGRDGGWKTQSRCWTAPVTTGQSMTITFDCGAYGITSFSWFIVEVTGHDTNTPTGGIASSASDTSDGAVSATLSAAPTVNDYVFAMVGVDGDFSGTVGVTPGSTFTEIAEVGDDTTYCWAQLQRRTGSTSTTADWVDIRTGTMSGYSHASQSLVIQSATVATSLTVAARSRKLNHLLVR